MNIHEESRKLYVMTFEMKRCIGVVKQLTYIFKIL